MAHRRQPFQQRYVVCTNGACGMVLQVPSKETQSLRPTAPRHMCPICNFQVLSVSDRERGSTWNVCPYCYTNVPREYNTDSLEMRCFQCAHPTCALASGRSGSTGNRPRGGGGGGPSAGSASGGISTTSSAASAPAVLGGAPAAAASSHVAPAAAATMAHAPLAAPNVAGHASSGDGQALMPCGGPRSGCGGRGYLMLRQKPDGQWKCECAFPQCGRIHNLAPCILAATIDGRCSACTQQLETDVFTMRLELAPDYAAARGRETPLHQVCAGCTRTLAELYESQ